MKIISALDDIFYRLSLMEDNPIACGLAVKAEDTGRILMIQRSLEDDNIPARGSWEFPGGKRDDGEIPFDAAIREWKEEVGQHLPAGQKVDEHTTPDGIYKLFIYLIPTEDDMDLHNGRSVDNPDDPDGDMMESSVWWDIDHAKENPALREEVKKTPWHLLEKA
jgi:8-oxo-dGTP pyrophosphatase MutT (NUDIX family)